MGPHYLVVVRTKGPTHEPFSPVLVAFSTVAFTVAYSTTNSSLWSWTNYSMVLTVVSLLTTIAVYLDAHSSPLRARRLVV
jgi:hypothetical protein